MQKNQLQMAKLLQLFNEWEIQLLVLFSFTLQVFLFFSGTLRRRTTSGFIRLLIWMAYLGADWVAVYALGFLSRYKDATTGKDTLMRTHQLAFFWVPFLLIHLGGQDTITALAIEDNNLWLRHLLNLVIQVTLALYIFWKSTSGPSMQLIVPSILLFVTGTIKYGERIWALWCGSLGSLNTTGKDASLTKFITKQHIKRDALYSDMILGALYSIPGVRDVFGDSVSFDDSLVLDIHPDVFLEVDSEEVHWQDADLEVHPNEYPPVVHPNIFPKLLGIELGLVYDDIYTKATVIRTRGGIILRCISEISYVAAFVLFIINNKQMFSVDTAITYVLFIGGFFLEVCAIFITVMSPWTWAWLKHREQRSGLFRFLVSINIGWQEKRQLWSNSMGQYSLRNYLGPNDQSDLWIRRVMVAAIKKMVNLVCGTKQKLWISSLLDTKFVEVDKKTMRCVLRAANLYHGPLRASTEVPTVGPLLNSLKGREWGFAGVIVGLHTYTELLLSRYSCTCDVSARVRKMSNYLLYLLVTHPEMLPDKKSLLPFLKGNLGNNSGTDLDASLTAIFRELRSPEPFLDRTAPLLLEIEGPFSDRIEELLKEIHDAWIGLLVYVAAKSRPEAHAAQLARGGEFLTLVWLFMAHLKLGDVCDRIKLADIFHEIDATPAGSPPPSDMESE